MPLLAYRGFQQPADANTVVASITENNLPPLLVLWLYFTTNPDFLTLSTPDTISQAQQFADIGNQLGLTAQCVSNLFRLATTHPASGSFNAVARIFQNVAAQSNYVAPGGRPCTIRINFRAPGGSMATRKHLRKLFLPATVLLVPLLIARKISSLERHEAGEPQTAAAAPSGSSAPVPCLPAADDDLPEFTELMKKNKMAQESTNEFTWKVLAIVSRPATKQRPITTANGNVVMSNDEEWETWADDSALFPRPADEQHPPCWDEKSRQRYGVNLTSGRSETKLIPAVVAVTESALAQQQAHAAATTAPAAPVPPASCESPGITCNEVRHNRHDFESIVKNRLWYVQGLKQVAALKVNGYIPQGQIIDHESIEIKAEWQRIQCMTDCEKKKLVYHWNYDKSGNLYGLVAFHLITRALDNWTLATFEWEGNPGRCDYYGCHDVWGGEDIDAPSQPTDQPYPAAKLSNKVTSLNWKGSAKSEWSHYRLKGTQTAFFGKDGKPTILGSSILERNVIGGRASCIICHAEASVTSDGMSANSLGKQVPTTAQARTARAGQQYAAIGTPELSSDSHPIGFIWSIIGATCDFSDTVHPCPSLKP